MAAPVNPDHVPKDLMCPICFNVPLEPRILKTCSHVFCKGCIQESLSRKKECPVCRCKCKSNQVLLYEKNGLFNRIWACIVVKCGHEADGCKWTGCISDYELHDSVCPKNKFRKEIDSLKKEIKQLKAHNQDLKNKLQDEAEQIRVLTARSLMLATAKEELEKIVRRFHRESRTALEPSGGSGNIDSSRTSGSSDSDSSRTSDSSDSDSSRTSDSSDSTTGSDSSDSGVIEYISATFPRSGIPLRPRRSSRRNHQI